MIDKLYYYRFCYYIFALNIVFYIPKYNSFLDTPLLIYSFSHSNFSISFSRRQIVSVNRTRVSSTETRVTFIVLKRLEFKYDLGIQKKKKNCTYNSNAYSFPLNIPISIPFFLGSVSAPRSWCISNTIDPLIKWGRYNRIYAVWTSAKRNIDDDCVSSLNTNIFLINFFFFWI